MKILGSFGYGYDALQLVRQLGGRLRAESGDARETTWLTQRNVSRSSVEMLPKRLKPV
jgi:hypothetical protein